MFVWEGRRVHHPAARGRRRDPRGDSARASAAPVARDVLPVVHARPEDVARERAAAGRGPPRRLARRRRARTRSTACFTTRCGSRFSSRTRCSSLSRTAGCCRSGSSRRRDRETGGGLAGAEGRRHGRRRRGGGPARLRRRRAQPAAERGRARRRRGASPWTSSRCNTGTLIRLTFADDGRGVPVDAFDELGQPFARAGRHGGIGHGAVRVPPARHAHARRAAIRSAGRGARQG